MCSIVEEDFGDDGGAHAMVEDPKSKGIEGEICKKCNIEKSRIKLDFKESMCVTCFLAYVRHKFRATLGSSKIVRRNSNVLLHFTGGPESVCLLDMIRVGFEQEPYKRLVFELEMTFVDESCVEKDIRGDSAKRFERIQEVKSVLEQFPNFKCFYSSIGATAGEMALITSLTLVELEAVIESERKFVTMFDSFKSLSSKQDFVDVTRKDVLRQAAVALKCSYVFVPDISITLATRLLTNISLGRGSSAAFDVAFCDDRIESLKFVRPIKDLSKVDVLSYLEFNNLKHLDVNNYGTDLGQFVSIQNLTSKFINDLQQNFSSTVSTVYRTCNKIAPVDRAPAVDEVPEQHFRNLDIANKNQRCVMCKAFLDFNNSETLFAIEFSRVVSECAGGESNTRESEEKANSAVNGNLGTKKNLCHGCRNIFIGLNDEELKEIF